MHIFEIDRLEQIVGKDRVREEEPLAKHTTFRIGGPAKWFVEPDSAEQLAACIKYLEEVQMQWYILGNGSNLLVADEGYDGVILSLHRMNKEAGQVGELHQIRILPADASETEKAAVLEEYGVKQCISTAKAYVSAGAGVMLSTLAARIAEQGLAGFEFAGGIPGTLGGAVTMNAGAYGGEIKDVIVAAKMIDRTGKIHLFSAEELHLSYRHSIVQEQGLIVVSALFAFEQGDRAQIKAQMQELNAKRREKQPLEYGSAGSTFKRPEGYFAGKLIEDAGLKGYRVGDIMVSEKHCGFVVNVGRGTCAQADAVIRHVQQTVKEQFGVTLETEVKRLPEQ